MLKLSERLRLSEQRTLIRRAQWTIGLGKIVPLYLLWQGLFALSVGISFEVLPHGLVTSNAVNTLYYLIKPSAWGGIFILLGVVCLSAVIWPKPLWRHAMLFLIEVQALWAVGLTVPVLVGVRPINVLAPMSWTQVLGTTLIILEHSRRFTDSR